MKIYFFFFLALLFPLFIVRNWFCCSYFSGYDSLFYFNESYSLYSLYPYAWSTLRESGMGGSFVPLLWSYAPNSLVMAFLGRMLGLQWGVIERIAFYLPFLVLAFYSSWYLASKTIVNRSFALISSLIYTANSYILMIMSGGQVHYSLAYGVTPFALMIYIDFMTKLSYVSKKDFQSMPFVRSALLLGLYLTVITALDIRLTYILLICVMIYIPYVLKGLLRIKLINGFIPHFVLFLLPLITLSILLSYWLFPLVLSGGLLVSQLGADYGITDESVQFLSFAKFENAVGLMHPNWPENIFGKTGFMKPEFLILPILAFSALLFINNKEQSKRNFILYFSLLGLLGAFLAKGSNEPFGAIYLWMFKTIPGFSFFRDSTKWYVLVALSYTVLIPFTLQKVYEFILKKQ